MDQHAAIDGTILADDPLPWDSIDGPWPGTVVSTEDPDKLGRIRVRVPQVYGNPTEDEFIPDEQLPWARPSMSVHDFHADFLPGDGIWVTFWGGSSRRPVWHGQFLAPGDAPAEFTSSYSPTPKTRILRTNGGQIIEMRWVEGEEQIRLVGRNGDIISLVEGSKVQGPKIDIITVGTINVRAATGINVTQTGAQPIAQTGQGAFNLTHIVAASVWQFLALTLTALTTVALTATGALTLTGATVTLVSGAAILLGSTGGTKKAVVLEDFLIKYDGHGHPHGVGPGTTGVPTLLSAPADKSVNVKVD